MKHKGISNTAAYVAIKFYGLSLNDKIGGLFPQEIIDYYSKLVQFLPSSLSWYHKALSHPAWRRFFVFTEELLLPGDLMHIIARKFYLHLAMQKAIKEGAEQLIIPGAGFDHSGILAADKGIRSIEIDSPQMTRIKRDFLNSSGYQSENLFLVEADLTRDRLSDLIREIEGFDPDLRTHVIAEGFFDYIPLKSAQEVLKDLNDTFKNLSLSSTFFSLDELNIFYRWSFTSGVAMVGEAIKLPLDLNGFKDLLSDSGFTIRNVISHRQMTNELIKPLDTDLKVLSGFYMIDASSISH